MFRPIPILALGLSVLIGGRSLVRADDQEKRSGDKNPTAKPADNTSTDAVAPGDPEAFLKSKGLKRYDPYFALADETDLNKRMTALDRFRKGVVDGQRLENRAEKDEADKKQAFVECLKRRTVLRDELAKNPPPNIYNNIVNQINQLGDEATLLQKELAEDSPTNPARAVADKAREAYIEQILEIRQVNDRVRAKYADLAADPKVAEMIAAYDKAHSKTFKLGPTTSFLSNDRKLKKFEETVLSDSIDIRRDGGDTWETSVVINGKDPKRIMVDTGASMVSLSYKVAKELGLNPSANDPTLQFTIADGRVVEAKKVVAKSVRVGKFEVEQVDVAVMPASFADAPSLLGQSFLKHFTYKIDAARSKLVMTKVDTSPIAPGGTTTKPR